MRERELKQEREMQELQLKQEEELLERQLAGEQEFAGKREMIRQKMRISLLNIKRLSEEGTAENGSTEPDILNERIKQWLDQNKMNNKPLPGGNSKGSLQGGQPGSSKLTTQQSSNVNDDFVESISDGDFQNEWEDNVSLKTVRSKHSVRQTPIHRTIRLTHEQLAARQVASKHLPTFRGEPEIWPLFISSFEYTTEACGFSNLDNLKRLQDCLQGDALEAVRSRLVLPDSVPDVIRDLRNLFGKPEKLLKTLLSKVRQAQAPRADRLESFIRFGITVKQLCDHLEAAHLNDHLSNPMLVQELVEKLPPSYKLEWVRFKRGKIDTPLRIFTDFMTDIVSDVSEISEFLPLNEPVGRSKEKPRRNEFVHLHNSPMYKPGNESHSMNMSRTCWVCKSSEHKVRFCDDFKRMSLSDRLNVVEKLKLCCLCLNSHGKSKCKFSLKCTVQNCKGNHHPLLHRREESVQLMEIECNAHNVQSSVIFRIVPVVLHAGKISFETLAFLDEGSSSTLVDEKIAKELKIKGECEPLIISWTGDVKRHENGSRRIQLMLSAIESDHKFSLENVRTVAKLELPKQSVRFTEVAKRYSHLTGLSVSEHSSNVPTILIGLDNLHLFAPLESRIGKPGEPIAVRSVLGWTVYGPEREKPRVETFLNLHLTRPASNQELHDMMRSQYVLEEQNDALFVELNSEENKRAQLILTKTTKRVGNRFETGLLWRSEERQFPDGYQMALRRMKALERKLENDQMLKENVYKQINQYQVKGYAHKATREELFDTPQSNIWYLPLNVVLNPRKPGKVRLVWDAAASVKGVSLNSELMKDPDMFVSLPGVICRFREKPIAFGGDIEEMYHQIRVRSEDKSAQRFLFCMSADAEPLVYVMDVLTFGSTCSPCSAQFVKNLNARQFADKYPGAVAAIVDRHYVDDYYDSMDTPEEAIQRAKEVKYIHSQGGFRIRNWVSNSKTFLSELGEVSENSTLHFNRDKVTEYERVLGIIWEPNADVFTFTTNHGFGAILQNNDQPTKRMVLSCVMSLFDPISGDRDASGTTKSMMCNFVNG
ncbi:uncharacterized protein LOC131428811 [Malaya genurostris]|uniref:uncharacterized protein LOC131428811 n=1 Tax=Malaya genurostris TaxID=325434 RepID=UPI0026F3BC5C|nr:uncharacterized protein LOC131428811 [Malaya genurostris]